MALILSLETSAATCSVALHKNRELLNVVEILEPQAHAAKLAVLIKKVVSESSINMQELQAVAISAGPGSYTGLRIGTSTAKGICYALNIPLIAVNTLDLLTFQVMEFPIDQEYLCPMIDAKRMEVYCQIVNIDLQIIQPVYARVIDDTSFHELLKDHKMLFFGDGAAKCKNTIQHENASFVDNIYPQASALGRIASTKFHKGEFEDLVSFVPLYLKEFIAKKAQSVF
jgi:tRNA threonylcarbamoyladenosine biosynthesis protein TsaB